AASGRIRARCGESPNSRPGSSPAPAVPARPRRAATGPRSRARPGPGAGGPWPEARRARSRPVLQPAGQLLRVADEVDAGAHLDAVRALVAHAVDVGELARLLVQP